MLTIPRRGNYCFHNYEVRTKSPTGKGQTYKCAVLTNKCAVSACKRIKSKKAARIGQPFYFWQFLFRKPIVLLPLEVTCVLFH